MTSINKKVFKVGNFYTKQFTNRKAMEIYYNKFLKNEKKYRIVACGLNAKLGYVCKWAY